MPQVRTDLPGDFRDELLVALKDVAEMVRDRGMPRREELRHLLLTYRIDDAWNDAVGHFEAWAVVLNGVRNLPDADMRAEAVQTLLRQGVPEGDARFAVDLVAPGVPETVEPPPAAIPVQTDSGSGDEARAHSTLPPVPPKRTDASLPTPRRPFHPLLAAGAAFAVLLTGAPLYLSRARTDSQRPLSPPSASPLTPSPAQPPATPLAPPAPAESAERAAQAAKQILDQVQARLIDLKDEQEQGRLTTGRAAAERRELRARCLAALAWAESAIGQDRRHKNAWVQRICALYYLSDYAQAARRLDEASALFPGSTDFVPLRALVDQRLRSAARTRR